MYIDKNGDKWFKGNLHTHTTVSDGRSTPEDTLKLYSDAGYDFIALTDHYKYGNGGGDPTTGILVVPGCEYHTGTRVSDGVYHIVSVFADSEPDIHRANSDPLPPVQTIIDKIKDANGIAILAHPAWSLDDPDRVLKFERLDACEIYNTVSGKPWNLRPYSGLFVDAIYAQGSHIGLVAADDAHFYDGDACQSFVYVKAEECTVESLREAILRGDCVASQGPMVRVRFEDKKIIAETDEKVKDITFYSDAFFARGRVHTSDDGLTSAEYAPSIGYETFVRVEVTDFDGKCAWSQAVFFEV